MLKIFIIICLILTAPIFLYVFVLSTLAIPHFATVYGIRASSDITKTVRELS